LDKWDILEYNLVRSQYYRMAVYLMRDSVFYRIWAKSLEMFGNIMLAFKPPRVKAEHLRKAMETAKPGMIICRRFTYYLDAHFIKGKYTHSGLVISDREMIHAVAKGVEIVDIIDYLKDTDGFLILQPPYRNEDDIKKVIEFEREAVKARKPYDYLFDKEDNRAYYCNELIWRAFKSIGLKIPVKKRIIYASDIIKFCKIIYETPF